MASFLTKALIQWNAVENQRQMPWKNEKSAYKIWLSEIMLQQTKVEQGVKYYEKFITAFPTIIDLANASATSVLKMWEGLGYYSRCRNLHATAKLIRDKYNGIFPKKYEEIVALKGVGTYTAAAITSFAYNLPYAVLDGNVYRVLSRFTANYMPIDTGAGKKVFTQLAQNLLHKSQPSIYNQAIMDFGATVCKPKNPLCAICVLQKKCKAFAEGSIEQLPVKSKKIQIRKRFFNYFIISCGNEILIHKRTTKDVWQDFYEFTLIETEEKQFNNNRFLTKEIERTGVFDAKITFTKNEFYQKLSHQYITAKFHNIELAKKEQIQNGIWIKKSKLQQYPYAVILNNYLKSINSTIKEA